MTKVLEIASGIGMLILVYLFVSNGTATSNIINTMATNTIAGIKTLQGR